MYWNFFVDFFQIKKFLYQLNPEIIKKKNTLNCFVKSEEEIDEKVGWGGVGGGEGGRGGLREGRRKDG